MTYLTRTVNTRVLSRTQNSRNLYRVSTVRALQRIIGNLSVSVTSGSSNIDTGTTSPPSSTPSSVGRLYIDTASIRTYVSFGTSSSADWHEVFISG